MNHLSQRFFQSSFLCAVLLSASGGNAFESITPNMNPSTNTTATTMPTSLIAEGTNSLFRHSVTVNAPAERVWSIWMDVPNWPTWDTELKEASASAPLGLGVDGKITPQSGPSSSFKVVSFEYKKQYAFETSLPMAKLKVTRVLTTSGGSTTFTHEVEFSGTAAPMFASQFGPVFRAALPKVMQKIAAQALRPQ